MKKIICLTFSLSLTIGAMFTFTFFYTMPFSGYYFEMVNIVVWRGVGMACSMSAIIAGLLFIALALSIPTPDPTMPLRSIRYPRLFPH